MCSRVSQSDREALERKPSSCDDEDDLCYGELESDEDILKKTEDDHPELQEVVGCKKKWQAPQLLKRLHIYPSQRNDKVFICTNQKPRNGGCNARVRQCKTSGIFRKDGRPSHNHFPELEKQQQLIIVNAVVEATEVSKENPRCIFDRVRSTHSGNIGFSEAVQRQIQRKKRERLPAIPRSVSMAAELLKANPELGLTLDGKSFYHGHVETVNGEGKALVFLSPSLTPELANGTDLQSDGTFRSLPKKFKQLLTIQLSFENKCYPFAFAMMNKKTRELYDFVMQKVLEAIRHRAQKMGLNGARQTVKRIVQELRQLALLPADGIILGYQYNIKDFYKAALRRESEPIQKAVKKLFSYYNDYWIDEVGAGTFSVYGLSDRTNNLIESWHRWFNFLCRGLYLNFWDFLKKPKTKRVGLLLRLCKTNNKDVRFICCG
ncbi:Uncharacterized protein APZ42_013838 [Daphnia magna]|uniref:FLYWCH-type domain-containing protein n=1 Tax=Daphnia magna TaxID=35525 RepID=A0A162QGJ8_9CRUS|nr:Uncharacterized protein APZ42_013838 [Daphnia magna]